MKIRKIRFRNLNSLRGEQPAIDFTRAPLCEAGLFVITGPTGAGKSTILDAITLALYGRAARYGSEAPSEMMSRHAGEAFAEVEFSSRGATYRSSWHLRRARNKPEGAFQQVKRLLANADTGEIIEEKVLAVDAQVERITGLDYSRFLRSVLLAQGQFAAFLKATENERSGLLQAITGTEIYSELSQLAHEIKERKREAVNLLRASMQAVEVLAPERRQAMEQQLLELARETEAVAAKQQLQAAALLKARELFRIARECDDKQRSLQEIAAKRLEFQPDLNRLERHRQTVPFQDNLIRHTDVAERLEGLQRELPGAKSAEENASRSHEQAKAAGRDATQTLDELRAKEPGRRQLFAKISALDHEVASARKIRTQSQAEADEVGASLKKNQTRLEEAAKSLRDEAARGQTLRSWKSDHAADERLGSLLAEWKEPLAEWGALVKEDLRLKEARQRRIQEGETAELECTALEPKRAAAAALQAELQTSMAALEKRSSNLLEGRTEDFWKSGATTLEARLAALKEAHSECSREAEIRNDIQAAERELAELAQAEAKSKAAKTAREAELEEAKRRKLACEKEIQAWETILSLEERRSELQPGLPCPLCGSTSHPAATEYRLGRSRRAEAAENLRKISTELNAAEKGLQTEVGIAAQLQAKAESLRTENGKRNVQLQTIRETVRQAADRGGLTAPVEGNALKEAINGLQVELGISNARLDRVRAAEKERHEFISKLSRAKTDRAAIEAGLTIAQSRAADARKARGDLDKQILDADRRMASLRDSLNNAMAAFAPRAGGYDEARDSIRQLEIRSRKWEETAAGLKEAEHKADKLATEAAHLRSLCEKETADLEQRGKTIAALTQEVERKTGERLQQFGEGSVAAAEAALNKELDHAQKASDGARQHEAEAQKQEALARERRLGLERQAEEQSRKLLDLETELVKALTEAGFGSIPEARMARLETGEADRLALRAEQLDKEQHALEERLKELRDLRASSGELGVTAQDLAEMEIQLAQMEQHRDTLRTQIGGLEQSRQQDDQRKAQLAAQAADAVAKGQEAERWSQLDALIGSANGMVFAKFAQGITLGRLVSLANRHLERLNPRYQIRRQEQAQLELEIVDRHQGGVKRPTESLSGGESFLVSLALALAVSELAGRNTQIDSLFIDEGFGALDSGTLEIAMAALENLQARGKTIGIISHIDLMKERISTQVQLSKNAQGWASFKVVA